MTSRQRRLHPVVAAVMGAGLAAQAGAFPTAELARAKIKDVSGHVYGNQTDILHKYDQPHQQIHRILEDGYLVTQVHDKIPHSYIPGALGSAEWAPNIFAAYNRFVDIVPGVPAGISVMPNVNFPGKVVAAISGLLLEYSKKSFKVDLKKIREVRSHNREQCVLLWAKEVKQGNRGYEAAPACLQIPHIQMQGSSVWNIQEFVKAVRKEKNGDEARIAEYFKSLTRTLKEVIEKVEARAKELGSEEFVMKVSNAAVAPRLDTGGVRDLVASADFSENQDHNMEVAELTVTMTDLRQLLSEVKQAILQNDLVLREIKNKFETDGTASFDASKHILTGNFSEALNAHLQGFKDEWRAQYSSGFNTWGGSALNGALIIGVLFVFWYLNQAQSFVKGMWANDKGVQRTLTEVDTDFKTMIEAVVTKFNSIANKHDQKSLQVKWSLVRSGRALLTASHSFIETARIKRREDIERDMIAHFGKGTEDTLKAQIVLVDDEKFAETLEELKKNNPIEKAWNAFIAKEDNKTFLDLFITVNRTLFVIEHLHNKHEKYDLHKKASKIIAPVEKRIKETTDTGIKTGLAELKDIMQQAIPKDAGLIERLSWSIWG